MEGLGTVGQQQPQEQVPFTMETAGKINEGIIASVGKSMVNVKKPKTVGLGSVDVGAMQAVNSGMVRPDDVLNDPKVSDKAKENIARQVGLV